MPSTRQATSMGNLSLAITSIAQNRLLGPHVVSAALLRGDGLPVLLKLADAPLGCGEFGVLM